jgi:hypothetical protein
MKRRLLPGCVILLAIVAATQADQSFNPPRYLYLITSRSRVEGPTNERTYVLWPDQPPANGVLVKGDGDGSTRNYQVQFFGGPFYTLSQVCAQRQLPADALRAVGCTVDSPQTQFSPAASGDRASAKGQRQKITWSEFFKRMLKLLGWGAVAIAAAAILNALFGSKPAAAPAVIMMGTGSGDSSGGVLEPTANVTPTFDPNWPAPAETELQILIEENLRAAGRTGLQFLDETDVRKVGLGMAEALNILDDLEAKAQAGKLTNAQARAGILDAFKHLGLDVLRAANLVMMLKALANLGASGIRALRAKLVKETVVAGTAIEAGVAAETEITQQILKQGGKNLNNIAALEKEIGTKLNVRGGAGKFPIVDVIDEGTYASIATSQQKSVSYFARKYKILFEGSGSLKTHAEARSLLGKIFRKEVTELSFQANARLIVPQARLTEVHAFVAARVKEFYLDGESGSALANFIVKDLRAKGYTGDALLKGVTSVFLKRVVGR